MILDLLSSDMYVSYNVQIANKIGLEEAIYISELININRKAIQKNKIEDGYFNIDRKYITNRTTFKLEKQIEFMEMNDIAFSFSSYERIREDGSEYWSARELQKVLQYKEWRKFE